MSVLDFPVSSCIWSLQARSSTYQSSCADPEILWYGGSDLIGCSSCFLCSHLSLAHAFVKAFLTMSIRSPPYTQKTANMINPMIIPSGLSFIAMVINNVFNFVKSFGLSVPHSFFMETSEWIRKPRLWGKDEWLRSFLYFKCSDHYYCYGNS